LCCAALGAPAPSDTRASTPSVTSSRRATSSRAGHRSDLV
jgi:hypothetical protein